MEEEKALRLWNNIPDSLKKSIISTVYCGQCGGASAIRDYRVDYASMNMIVLRGFCAKCGHKVARCVEDCPED